MKAHQLFNRGQWWANSASAGRASTARSAFPDRRIESSRECRRRRVGTAIPVYTGRYRIRFHPRRPGDSPGHCFPGTPLVVLAGHPGSTGDIHRRAAQIAGQRHHVVRGPLGIVGRAPHVVGVAAECGDDSPRIRLSGQAGGGVAATVGGDRPIETRMACGEHQPGTRTHRDACDRPLAVTVERGIDQRRQLVDQECFPLVAAEFGIITFPVGVQAAVARQRHHDVDVLVGVEAPGIGLAQPHAVLRVFFTEAAEQVQRRTSPVGVCRGEHLHLDRLAHRRGVHIEGGEVGPLRRRPYDGRLLRRRVCGPRLTDDPGHHRGSDDQKTRGNAETPPRTATRITRQISTSRTVNNREMWLR